MGERLLKRSPSVGAWIHVLCAIGAVTGIVCGREWRLLLIPMAIVPFARLLSIPVISGKKERGRWARMLLHFFQEAACFYVITSSSVLLAFHFGGGSCVWAPSMMVAATASVLFLPVFTPRTVMHPLLRVSTLLLVVVWGIVSPFVSNAPQDAMLFGFTILAFCYGAVRFILGLRDLRREALREALF